jgi:hypothetical protein
MFAVLLGIAAAVVSAPIGAAILVSIASRREDTRWSLDRPAQGPISATARRIVDFHSELAEWPRPRGMARPARDLQPSHSSAGEPPAGEGYWAGTRVS